MTTETLERPPGVYLDETGWVVVPNAIGPTWDRDPDWDGPRDRDGYILPKMTLARDVLPWIKTWLLNDMGETFQLTREQTRFLCWWYAVDENGVFVYRDGIFQRLKGHGKDPLVAVISAVEFVGPCRFSHFDDNGRPVAKDNPRAWIQIAAVSKDQTRNTMRIFPTLFSKAALKKYDITVGKELVYGYHGARVIEAVTSAPTTLEGARATFVVRNETQHWRENNEGHEMAAVIERNATKSRDGAARAISITNAYEPSDNSFAQQQRESWELEQQGLSIDTGVIYDSLEAPEDAMMRPPKASKDDPDPTDDEIKAYLGAIIRAVRGDSDWLDVDRIVASVLDRNNPPSRSRRFWFNLIKGSEDAWANPKAVDAAKHPMIDKLRHELLGHELIKTSWELLAPDDEIALFFDGSKSGDATGIVACRLSDMMIFTMGVWQKPPGARGEGWIVNRQEVSDRVHEIFKRFNVVGFYADPSHAKDDDESRFWDSVIDGWHRAYKDQLRVWSVRTGDNQHSIMWDMTSPQRTAQFVGAAEAFSSELHQLNDIEEFAPTFMHDGHPSLVAHLKNARQHLGQFGTSLMKESPDSANKIDLAVCAVGARMVARLILNREEPEKGKKAGTVWW